MTYNQELVVREYGFYEKLIAEHGLEMETSKNIPATDDLCELLVATFCKKWAIDYAKVETVEWIWESILYHELTATPGAPGGIELSGTALLNHWAKDPPLNFLDPSCLYVSKLSTNLQPVN